MVIVAIQNEREWQRFCETVLELPETASDDRFNSNGNRVANRPELDEIISGVTRSLSRDEFIARLVKADVAYGSVNAIADLSSHPAMSRRQGTSSQGNPVNLPSRAIRHLDTNWTAETPARAPKIGEHSSSIRQEFES